MRQDRQSSVRCRSGPYPSSQRKLESPSFRATEPDPSFRWDDGMTDRTEAKLADRFRRHLA